MKNLKIISAILLASTFLWSINITSALYTPKDKEELKKQYDYIKLLRTPLSEEEKAIIKRYEENLEFEKEAEESYQELLKEKWIEERATKTDYFWNYIKNLRNNEPELDKIMRENPNMSFNEAFQIFKKIKKIWNNLYSKNIINWIWYILIISILQTI